MKFSHFMPFGLDFAQRIVLRNDNDSHNYCHDTIYTHFEVAGGRFASQPGMVPVTSQTDAAGIDR